MITIRCTNPERPAAYTLLVGPEYKVGRKNHDINFPDDQSISREHATIVVEHPMANMTDPLLTPTVVVTDMGSKFGTFANDGIERKSKMAMRESLNLTPGDRFKFGLQWNEYKIEYKPLIVTASTLKEAVLKDLKKAVMTLGGHMVQEWAPECNYVIMDGVTLTVKVVCALVSAKHIVTPVYFQDMLQALNSRKPLPDPNDFLPPVHEKNLKEGHTWEPVAARRTLFKGKIFVFCGVKHMKKMGLAVEIGGGTCKIVADVSNKELLKDNVILVKPSDRDLIVADSLTRDALAVYSKGGKRLVQDSEIGMAALYLSTDCHCNPYYTFNEGNPPLPKIPSQSQNPDKNTTVVPGTQESVHLMETQLSYVPGEDNSNRQVVDETILEEDSSSKDEDGRGSKRDVKDVKVKNEPMSVPKDESQDEPPSKKRPAEEALTRLREKRFRPEAVPISPQRSTRSTRNTQRGGGLSAIFGVSDDEEDGDPDIIPASQTQTRSRNSGQQQMESATMDPTSNVDVIPASPEISDQEENPTVPEIVPVFKSPERRTTRLQARTSPQNPVEPRASTSSQSSSGSRTKRKIVESSPETSPVKIESQAVSKRQKTKQARNENENAVQKAEKQTIKPDVKDILMNQNEGPAPKSLEVHVSLLRAPKFEPKIEVVNGKTVKNFKTFLKVLPLSMQQLNVSVASGSSRGKKSGSTSTTKTSRSMRITFMDYEHIPMGSTAGNSHGRRAEHRAAVEDDVQQHQSKRRITRDEEEEMDAEIADIMPDTDAPPSESESPINNTRSSRRTTRGATKAADPPPREESASPPPRAIERTSPRQKKKIQKVILSDDEDDDMFQF